MTKYDITIEGYEDGLTAGALEDMFGDYFPDAESVEVVEAEASD